MTVIEKSSIFDHWKFLSRRSNPEQDIIVPAGQHLTLQFDDSPSNTRRDLFVRGHLEIENYGTERGKFECRDILVIGGHISVKKIELTFRYLIQMSDEQFSRASLLRKERDVREFPRDKIVPSSRFLSYTFELTPDVNAVDPWGHNSLMTASQYGDEEIVRFLLAANASVRAWDRHKWTPLLYAAMQNNGIVAELLLEAQADIQAQNVYGNTPLYNAAKYNCPNTAALLIRAKADTSAMNDSGQTVISKSVDNGAVEVLSLLLAVGVNLSAHNPKPGHMSAKVMYAAVYGQIEWMKEAIKEEGFNTEVTNDICQTPLILAARYGHLDIVKLLVENGADRKASDADGTALFWAQENGHTGVINYLNSCERTP